MNNSEEGQEMKLPARASLEHLRKQAKRRAQRDPALKLAEAQHQLAKEYGCKNWAELVRGVESRSSLAKPEDAFAAIHRGDVTQLVSLLDAHPAFLHARFDQTGSATRPRKIDLRGSTLLHMAVEFGERECVDALLDRAADINTRALLTDGVGGQTPIFHAIANADRSLDLLEHLLRRTSPWIDMSVRASLRLSGKATRDVTPLEYAMQNWGESHGSPEKRRVLELLYGADRRTQLKNAIRQGNLMEVTRFLAADPALLEVDLWPTAIYQAKSLAMTRQLLERGLDPNRCSAPRLPLHLAVYQVLPEIVECLLLAGADPVFRNSLGETPLDLLDAYEPRPVGDPEVGRIRELLLAAGAEMNVLSAIRLGDALYLETLLASGALLPPDALHATARSARPETASVLLRHGADPNRANDKGNTPLWFAAQSPAAPEGRIAVMKLLLDAGADLHQRCERGSTALHFAAWRGPIQVVEFLLSRGARVQETDDKGETPLDYTLTRPPSDDRQAVIGLLDAGAC